MKSLKLITWRIFLKKTKKNKNTSTVSEKPSENNTVSQQSQSQLKETKKVDDDKGEDANPVIKDTNKKENS